MNSLFKNRVIVGGLPRSGSTLLRTVIGQTTDVFAGPETGFFLKPFDVQQSRSKYVCKRFNEKWLLDTERIRSVLDSSDNAVDFFDKIVVDFCIKNKVVIPGTWVEKSPRNCLNYNYLHSRYKGLIFLSTVRDGRDVVTSKFQGCNDYYCSVERYVESMKSIYSFDTDRHLIVKYEDMVSDPIHFFTSIGRFMKCDFDVRHIDPKNRNYSAGVTKQNKVHSVITSEYIERWRKPEHEEIINRFYENKYAMYWLMRSGYSLD